MTELMSVYSGDANKTVIDNLYKSLSALGKSGGRDFDPFAVYQSKEFADISQYSFHSRPCSRQELEIIQLGS